MPDPISHAEAIDMLLKIHSVEEWKTFAHTVKKSNGGRYPEWWFPKIIQSGLADHIMAEFGGSTKITAVIEP